MTDRAFIIAAKALVILFSILLVISVLAGCASVPAKPKESSYKLLLGDKGHCTAVKIDGGMFLTAAHCFASLPEGVEPRLIAGKAGHNITRLWTSPEYDLAAFSVEGSESMAWSTLRCFDPVIGEEITAVGNPYELEGFHSFGRVASHVGKIGPWENAWSANISFFQGMSGGPVYDSTGRVVGIVTGFRSAMIFTIMGAAVSWSDIGLFVPASQACKLIGR